MSSTDDKTDSGSRNGLDIEACRQHLLNYRSKVNESESDMTYQFDLDSSFKRILEEKRQMTNKENNPPAIEQTIANPPEKPLRKDLMKERLRSRVDDSYMDQSSYVMEHSIGTDMEFSTINRLLENFNINHDSTFAPKRSPLKMLKITGDSLNDFGSSSSQNGRRDDAETTFNTAHTRVQATNILIETSSSANADDTLEEIEYIPRSSGLNYVPKRLINEIQSKPEKHEEIKANVKNEKFDGNDENQENENDENIENMNMASAGTKPDTEFDDSIILIESSPENSFISTLSTERFKSAVESIESTFHTAKADPSFSTIYPGNDSVLSVDSDKTIDQSNEVSSSVHKVATRTGVNDNEMPLFNDSLERVDYMMELGRKLMNERNEAVAVAAAATAPKTPISQTQVAQPKSNKKTPISQSKAKVLTPSSATLKKVAAKNPTPKHPTPNKVDLFKRPEQRNVRSPFTTKSASASKVQPPIAHSRIPTKVPGSLNKPQFRHIASPIAAYIKNTPEVPLIKTIKPMRNLLTEDFNKVYKPSSVLDESTQSVESFPKKSALPRKMYISASQRQIIDHRYKVTPGGKTVQKLIGNAPLVIRHEGKVKCNNGESAAAAAAAAQQVFEESLSDLSMISGDISVQVVKDVHRGHEQPHQHC